MGAQPVRQRAAGEGAHCGGLRGTVPPLRTTSILLALVQPLIVG